MTYGKSGLIMPQTQRPKDPNEHALVIKALRSGLSDCVEWRDERLVQRVQNDPDMCSLRPQFVRIDLIEAVRRGEVEVVQKLENRPEHKELYLYYYKVILFYEEVPSEVFVELVLSDSDPDYPAVSIVRAHPQRRS